MFLGLALFPVLSFGSPCLFVLPLVSDARPVAFVDRLTDVYAFLSDGECGAWGTGGMYTKVVASKIATNVGVHVAISNGQHPERILDILKYAERSGETGDVDGLGAGSGGTLFPRIAPPRDVRSLREDKDGSRQTFSLPVSSSHGCPLDKCHRGKGSRPHEEAAAESEEKPSHDCGEGVYRGDVVEGNDLRRDHVAEEKEEERAMLSTLPALSLPSPSLSSLSNVPLLPGPCDGVSFGEEAEAGEREDERILARRRSSVCSSVDGGIYGGGWQDDDADEDGSTSEALFGEKTARSPPPLRPVSDTRRTSGGFSSQGDACPSYPGDSLEERGGEQEKGRRSTRREEAGALPRHEERSVACNGRVQEPKPPHGMGMPTPLAGDKDSARASAGEGRDSNTSEVHSSTTPVRGGHPHQQPFPSLTVCSSLDHMPFLGKREAAPVRLR